MSSLPPAAVEVPGVRPMDPPLPALAAGRISGDPAATTMATYAIHAARELDLLTAFGQGGASAAELAAQLGVDADALYRLLRALWSLGVLSEQDGVFALGPMAAFSNDGSIGDSDPAYPLSRAWAALADGVRAGRAAFETVYGQPFFTYLEEHPDIGTPFHTRLGARGEERDARVVEAYDFSRFSKLVDVAGGTGGLLAGILRRNPSASGVLFDRPSVVQSARDSLDEDVRRRIEFVEGDMFASVPGDGDAYLLSSILHDWDDERSLELLKVVGAAMRPSASLLIVEMVLADDARDIALTLLDLEMLVLTGGKERTRQQYSALLQEAGLQLEAAVPTESLWTILVAQPGHAARKSA